MAFLDAYRYRMMRERRHTCDDFSVDDENHDGLLDFSEHHEA